VNQCVHSVHLMFFDANASLATVCARNETQCGLLARTC